MRARPLLETVLRGRGFGFGLRFLGRDTCRFVQRVYFEGLDPATFCFGLRFYSRAGVGLGALSFGKLISDNGWVYLQVELMQRVVPWKSLTNIQCRRSKLVLPLWLVTVNRVCCVPLRSSSGGACGPMWLEHVTRYVWTA